MNPSPTKPKIIMAQVEGSGTALVYVTDPSKLTELVPPLDHLRKTSFVQGGIRETNRKVKPALFAGEGLKYPMTGIIKINPYKLEWERQSLSEFMIIGSA
jgi:hypothetical protein